MSALESQLSLGVWTPVKPKRPRNTPLTRDERLTLFGHLTFAEKQALRAKVSAAQKKRAGIAYVEATKIRHKCEAVTGPFGRDNHCRMWAIEGSHYCGRHQDLETL